MDTNSAFGIIDILVIAGGAYVLYAYYLLVAKNEIKEGVLVPKNNGMKKCKDLEGYKKYMGFRILLFGIVTVIAGGIGLYQDYVKPLPSMVYLITLGIFLVCVVWFMVCMKKAEKQFF